MTFLSAVVLLSLLAYNFCEASYPDHYDIEKSVLGFISHDTETPICGVALVTNVRGIAPAEPIKHIETWVTDTYAVIEKGSGLTKAVYKICSITDEKDKPIISKQTTPLALIALEGRNEDLFFLVHGLDGPNEIKSIECDRSLLEVYGLTTDHQAKALTVQDVHFSPDAKLLLQLDSAHDDINFVGASVMYDRNFVAMCDEGKSEGSKVLSCKSVLNLIKYIKLVEQPLIAYASALYLANLENLRTAAETVSDTLSALRLRDERKSSSKDHGFRKRRD